MLKKLPISVSWAVRQSGRRMSCAWSSPCQRKTPSAVETAMSAKAGPMLAQSKSASRVLVRENEISPLRARKYSSAMTAIALSAIFNKRRGSPETGSSAELCIVAVVIVGCPSVIIYTERKFPNSFSATRAS